MRSNNVAIPIAALLLVGAATMHYRWAQAALELQARDRLEQQWAAMKGYLRIERIEQNVQDQWYYDDRDPDESTIVNDIRSACFIMDAAGSVLRAGPVFQEFGSGFPAEVRTRSNAGRTFWVARHGARRLPYLVRAGVVFGEDRSASFQVALATPLSGDRSMLVFNWLSAGVILTAVLLGWLLGRMPSTSD
jgi:hypothetical protein